MGKVNELRKARDEQQMQREADSLKQKQDKQAVWMQLSLHVAAWALILGADGWACSST